MMLHRHQVKSIMINASNTLNKIRTYLSLRPSLIDSGRCTHALRNAGMPTKKMRALKLIQDPFARWVKFMDLFVLIIKKMNARITQIKIRYA